jgi:hypothetical protein
VLYHFIERILMWELINRTLFAVAISLRIFHLLFLHLVSVFDRNSCFIMAGIRMPCFSGLKQADLAWEYPENSLFEKFSYNLGQHTSQLGHILFSKNQILLEPGRSSFW